MENKTTRLLKQFALFAVVFATAFFGALFLIKKFKNPTNTQPATEMSSDK